jgi:hypothetical protein
MWKYETSRERLLKRRDALPEISISDLTRQATLANISFAAPKRVTGVHGYLGLANADALIEEPLDPDDHWSACRASTNASVAARTEPGGG